MWLGTHRKNGPYKQKSGADGQVFTISNSEDDTENRERQRRLDNDGRKTSVRLKSIGGKDTGELLANAHELVDDENGDNDVEGNGEGGPRDTKVDGAALEEVATWSGALIKHDDTHS